MLKRVLDLLLPQEKKLLVRVIISIFVVAMLDFISLASLMPILYFLLKGGDNTMAVVQFSIVAFVVILVKFILNTKLGKFQGNFTLSLYKRLSFSLFHNYYSYGLMYIKDKGYSTLGHSVNYMCYAFSQGVVAPFMRLVADLLLISLVTLALLVYDWKTVLVLYLSFVPLVVSYRPIVKDKVKLYGKEDYKAKQSQARIVADSFRGYSDLETNNAFPKLLKQFEDGLNTISNSRLKLESLQRIPLFISEMAIIIGLVVMVMIGGENASVLVGVFAVAAFRLVPALRGIISSYNIIQNSIPCIEVLEEGLKVNDDIQAKESEKGITFNHTIQISDIEYNYGTTTVKIGSHTIHKGEYVGFKGYSGIGKTTLFNILLGFLFPSKGEITIDGVRLELSNRRSWLDKIGYVPQDPFIFNGTIAQNIALGEDGFLPHKVEDILSKVKLSDWLKSLPSGINTKVGESGCNLSGGQKQRIAIARALYKGAQVLLLDEATSSVDVATERDINNMLFELKNSHRELTILSIAHRESTLSYCSRIINLEDNECQQC